jgi:hypothetical protein
MILLRILEHDLHRPKRGLSASPYMIEVPALPGFVPAVVSNSRGNFLIARKLTKDNRIRVGVFEYDSDRLDDIVTNMFDTAIVLSRSEKWNNMFMGPNAAKLAAGYIKDQSGMSKAQPHACLIPVSWQHKQIEKFFKPEKLDGGVKYDKHCHIVPAKVSVPIFCSRPDMVGMYTQFLGGGTGILLHNVKSGLAFCPDAG